jgi:peptidoglycan DL-endopeptidase CwlO
VRPAHLCWVAAAIGLAAALVASPLGAAPSKDAPSKDLQAKEALAKAVLGQVDALDRQFERTDEDWNVARLQERSAAASLASNKRALALAERAQRRVEAQVAERLVLLYETEDPSTIDVIAGSATLGDVIDRVQAKETITASDHRLAVSAAAKRQHLARVRETLLGSEQERAAALRQLGRQRARIGDLLSRRRTLLDSVQSEVTAIQARERREQARLAAQAEQRLARQRLAEQRLAEQRLAEQRVAEQRVAVAHEAALRRQRAAEASRAAAQPAHAGATPPPAAAPPPPSTATTATATIETPAPATTTIAPPPVSPPVAAPPPATHSAAATIALGYLGVPYKWGGASRAAGFDCSGLVMAVYAQLGVQLPHSSQAQYGLGVAVPKDQLQPGDLVFFDALDHVGIYIGGGQIVHAPHTGDVVRIATLASFGARYVGARRV